MWRKNKWCLVIFLIITSVVSAKSINFQFPKNVELNKEFEVSLQLIGFEEGGYDAKIEILGNGGIISQIYDENEGKWKSSYYYVKEIVFSNKKFMLRINKNFIGKAEISIKLRKEKNVDSFGNYTINILSKSNYEKNDTDKSVNDIEIQNNQEETGETINSPVILRNSKKQEDEPSTKDDEYSKENYKISIIEKRDTENRTEILSENNPGNIKELIRLNQKDVKVIYQSDSTKIKSFLIVSFIGFLIIFILSAILIKIKNKKYIDG